MVTVILHEDEYVAADTYMLQPWMRCLVCPDREVGA